jgi:hypothetical protein
MSLLSILVLMLTIHDHRFMIVTPTFYKNKILST